MRASTSAEKSDLAGVGAVTVTAASFCSAAHCSGKLAGARSSAAAPPAAAAPSAKNARRRALLDRGAILVLRFGMETLLPLAGAGRPMPAFLKTLPRASSRNPGGRGGRGE